MNIHFGLESAIPTLMYVAMIVVFFASVFWKPSLGIYLLVFALPLETGRAKLEHFFLGAQFLDILLLGTILGLLFKERRLIVKTPWTKFFVLLILFYYFSLWEGSIFTNAPFPLWITDPRFSDWKNYIEMFVLAIVVASVMREKRQVQLLVLVMCFSVLIASRSFYSAMSGRDLSHFSYDIRDAGVLGYAGVNGLAAFEAMVISFLLGFYAFTKRIVVKIGIVLLLITCFYCLLYSYSRGGYLGALIGIVTVGVLKTRKLLILAAVLVIGWQTLLPVSVQERILMTNAAPGQSLTLEPSAGDRIVLWQDAFNLFKSNPVTGTGYDTYKFMQRVGGYSDTHNYYIKTLVETGIVGFALFMILLWKLFRTGISLLRGTTDPFWQGFALGFVALMASMVVSNLFGDRWTYQQVDGYIWVLLGCVISGLKSTGQVEERATAPSTRPLVKNDRSPVVWAPSPKRTASVWKSASSETVLGEA